MTDNKPLAGKYKKIDCINAKGVNIWEKVMTINKKRLQKQ